MRVLVCGSRSYHNEPAILHRLEKLDRGRDNIVHGDCESGADHLADHSARQLGLDRAKFPANWVRYSKAAGHIRNGRMLNEGTVDLVIAFWDGKSPGTTDMVNRARFARIPTEVYDGKGKLIEETTGGWEDVAK